MKKIKGNNSLKTRAFKAGSYSLAVCAISLIAVILVNLIISALPSKYVEIDMSSNDLYSISDYSKQIVSNINTDVTIYHLATEANIDDGLSTLLSRYVDLNDHIKVEVRDPELSQIASKYTTEAVSENSLIFVTEKRNKVVNATQIYEYSEEMMQYMYYGYEATPDIFDGESEITTALDFVTTDILPKIYALTGHGEYELIETVRNSLVSQNIELSELDLVLEKTVPEDCECLLVMSPSIDIADKELEAIKEYLVGGGRIFVTTLFNNESVKKPNFDLLLEEYGIKAQDGMIIEGDQNKFYYSPNYLVPTVESHDITDPIIENGYYIFIPIAQNLKTVDSHRSSLKIDTLFTTSEKAFIRTDLANQSAEKSETDIEGQFTLGYTISETVANNEMKGVVISTPYFLDETFLSFSGNLNIFLNSIKWLCGLDEKISVVESKSLMTGGPLEITDSTGLVLAAVIAIIIPVALLVVGIVIFVRRKKR